MSSSADAAVSLGTGAPLAFEVITVGSSGIETSLISDASRLHVNRRVKASDDIPTVERDKESTLLRQNHITDCRLPPSRMRGGATGSRQRVTMAGGCGPSRGRSNVEYFPSSVPTLIRYYDDGASISKVVWVQFCG